MDAVVSSGRKRRIFRGVEEKLRIVKQALEPGASVASVALANGVNANQVFRWKRQYERGEFEPRRSKSATALVPVTVAGEAGVAKLVCPAKFVPEDKRDWDKEEPRKWRRSGIRRFWRPGHDEMRAHRSQILSAVS